MGRRLLIMVTILLVVGASTVYVLKETGRAKLLETVKLSKQVDDFILHIRVESTKEGIQVLRSLEYKGKDSVDLLHRTPLISISLGRKHPNFTGSPVNKTLNPGDIYYPQESKDYSTLEAGDYTLFVHCQFVLNNELIEIKTDEKVIMQ